MQRKKKNFSSSGGVTLHKSMRNVRQSERNGSKEIVSYTLVVVRGDPETYEEIKISQGKDRWVQGMSEELQSF